MESLIPVLVRRRAGAAHRRAAGRHATCCWPTRSGSAPGRTTWCAPARSSSRRPGWPRGRRRQGADRPRRVRLPRARPRSLEHARDTGRPWLDAQPADQRRRGRRSTGRTCGPVESYRGDIDARVRRPARAHRGRRRRGARASPAHGTAERAVERLRRGRRAGAAGRRRAARGPRAGRGHRGLRARWRTGSSRRPPALVVLTETDLTGGRHGTSTRDMSAKMPSRRRNAVDPLALQARRLRGARAARHRPVRRDGAAHRRPGPRREYLVLEYASSKRGQPGDRLFVPTDQLDQLSRYVGGELPDAEQARRRRTGRRPRAGPARRSSRSPPSWCSSTPPGRPRPGTRSARTAPWQRELEDAFPYTETPDQMAAIDEVKADMERPVPMDRVICGDVGYGKTEIAVRAAFKAVQDGKQVAVLVPTTLLAQQHLHTFTERMRSVPGDGARAVPVHRSDAEAREVIAGLADGAVDIVIGTHRLLQTGDAVQGPRPGDRRRGAALRRRAQGAHQGAAHARRRADHVGHPDPADAGDEPGRHPGDVHDPHPARGAAPDPDLRRGATTTSRSAPRSGASCCATARCSTCTTGSPRSRRRPGGSASWCPEARVAVAHGQMNEDRLEKIIDGFWDREYDVLVCTTIVETGLDISNANTLIVERGDAARAGPAAPAARPGRPRPGARVRLLPVPAGDAADRDRARPAGHHRAEHRARRRHGGGDEGPGDPRRRQHPRRRAVRAHRRRRVRPLRPAGRRGGGRRSAGTPAPPTAPRRRGARRGPGRPAGRRAHPARLRARGAAAAGGVPQDRRGAGRRGAGRGRRGADRPLRRAAAAGAQPARGGARSGRRCRRARGHRGGAAQGSTIRFARCRCATRSRCG